jgi:hypothetical protein
MNALKAGILACALSQLAWATNLETAAPSVKTTAQAETPELDAAVETEMARDKALQVAAMAWMRALAQDMQLSADPLGRAMAQTALDALAAEESGGMSPAMTERQRQEMLSTTSTPILLWHIATRCRAFRADKLCSDPKFIDVLERKDPHNAYVALMADSLRAGAMEAALDVEPTSATDKKIPETERWKARRAKTEARAKQSAAEFEIKLANLSRFEDYSQAFKAPLLTAIKRRPPPPELYAKVPVEAKLIVLMFPPEEVIAEAAGAMVFSMTFSPMQSGLCGYEHRDDAICQKMAKLMLENPKNSYASAAFALNVLKDHPYLTRLAVFKDIERTKAFEPMMLLGADWAGLKDVLSYAVKYGDVASIPRGLSWLEKEAAKIPNKTLGQLAAEEKKRAMEIAKYEDSTATDAASAAAEAATDAASAAAEAAATEAAKAASESALEPKS